MIIGLSGYAGSGKDEVAKVLVNEYGFVRKAFADKIREVLYEMNPHVILGYDMHTTVQLLVDNEGWDAAKQHQPVRELLQTLGVGCRKVFGENFWIVETMRDLDFSQHYVFTDVRFQNEAKLLKKFSDYGTQVWRVKRDGVGPVNGHISEHDLDEYKFDQLLKNEGTLDEFHALVRKRLEVARSAN